MASMSETTEERTPLLERPEVQEQLERTRQQFRALDTMTRRFVRDQPLVAVGAALALGYALGRLLVRR